MRRLQTILIDNVHLLPPYVQRYIRCLPDNQYMILTYN